MASNGGVGNARGLSRESFGFATHMVPLEMCVCQHCIKMCIIKWPDGSVNRHFSWKLFSFRQKQKRHNLLTDRSDRCKQITHSHTLWPLSIKYYLYLGFTAVIKTKEQERRRKRSKANGKMRRWSFRAKLT